MATVPTSTRQRIDISNPIITRIQVEGNDVVSFLNGTTAPYQYVRGMSQIMPQTPTYISYRYDTITISQVAGDAFTFTVYTITDVGGNAFTPLTFQDPADVVQAKTIEIYRLLVTSVFKGCCECGNTEPECSIQYTAGRDADIAGTLLIFSGTISINYFTANNQDFTGFWPIIQDGSWIFIFSKTDPTVYGVFQLSNYSDGGTFAQFDISLLAGTDVFPDGTSLCVDVTSVGGSLVQGWQDTLDIDSVLDKDNTVDGAGFDFVFDNNSSFTINSAGGSVETDATGASLNAGSQQILVTSGYIDIITPLFASAGTGWVLAKTASGHVEYVEAGTGTVTSVALDMPSAFTVTGSPIEDSGTFVVTGAGTDLQYINGLGELATFPVYTVANGLHTQESPADPFVFHLGGQLIENTLIDTNQIISPTINNEYQFAIRANKTSAFNGQDNQFPLGVANLGNGGVATFRDYGSGFRPNPSVEIVGDVDLFQPLLELRMEGDLPNPNPVLANRISLLRLTYDGTPANARTAIDFSFKNNDVSPNQTVFPFVQLSAQVTNFNANAETADFELLMVQGGSQQVKLLMEGKGQLTLNEYGPSGFSDATTNINNSLTYVLGVDSAGKVWKTNAGTGTVTSIDVNGGVGISVSPAGPITTSGTFTVTNTAPDQIVTLTQGANVTITGTYPNFTIAAGGGGTGTVTSVGVSAGTGISASVANPTTTPVISIANTAPDQIVSLATTGTGLAVTGTYPNFTLQNTLPDQIVSLNAGTNVTITGTYPSFTINASGGGPGTTYDSNQGIYKDTSGANDTFLLGTSLANAGTVPFQESRYITANTHSLYITGTGNTITSGVFNVTGGDYAIQGNGILRGVTGLATGGGFGSFGGWFEGFNCVYATSYDPGGNGYNVVLAGGANMIGSELYNGTALTFSDADAASLYKAARFSRNDYSSLGPQQNFGLKIDIDYSLAASGSVATASSLVSKLYQTGYTTAKTQFEIQGLINGNASLTPQFTILGGGTSGPAGAWTLLPGQIKFNQYAAGAIYKSSEDLLSNSGYGLGVDSNGNIWATDLSGGGGSGITTINGATEAVQEFFIQFGGTGESTPTINTVGGDHTIYIPYADGGRPGVITAAQFLDFTTAYTNRITSLTTTGSGAATLISNTLNIPAPPLSAKGDIYTFSTVDARLPVGTNGQMLYADSTTATGLKWDDAPSGGGGGGRSYYLNGSINQGTFAGINMKQMSPVPISGAGTNFVINADGYIASFITDAGDPNKVLIPAGNWNFELWFGANSGGGSPNFYVELSKYDTVGGTFTPIASGVGAPEGITGGAVVDLYFTALSVPQTTLALTDRLAVRVWVNHSGRTITLYTEDNRFSQVITSFPSGIASLNGLTAFAQTFATPGTTGTAPAWLSSTSIHTLNIPFASASGVTAGLISKTEYDTFSGKVGPTRSISTTAPLTGGGDLSADRTLSIPLATNSVDGYLSAADRTAFNAKQDAITGAATTITTSNLTVDRALISNASGKVAVSSSLVGYGLATLTDPSAVRYLKINSDNTVALRTAAEMVSDLGLGTGSVSILGQFTNGDIVAASTTRFGALFNGSFNHAATDAVRRTPMVTAGTLTRLYVMTNTAQPATGSLVCTLRKNSVDQALTITIAAGSAAGVFTDLVNAVSVVAGDQMGMKFVNNATTSSAAILNNQVQLTI